MSSVEGMNAALLPSDLEACHTLIRDGLSLLQERHAYIEQQDAINESLARDNQRLKFELEQLKRYIYGQRSERHRI